MKKLSYLISTIIAVGIIVLIEPYINEAKENSKYSFEVQTKDGDITKESFEGKVLAIYFGYTFCPDVCPTSLSSLAHALNSFDKEVIEKNFEGLFISVDPNRDKLEDLASYAKYFHPTFKGATSNKENIDDIVKRYGTYYKKIELENSSMGYSVAHTSYIYFFDKKGNFVKKVDHFSNPEQLKKVLKSLL
ncbi:SCO family protein [Arcobacter sp. YIC-464]|uniref:SCO family protein n=1 Tax=Arcobacter sp. YIC-464 TaxID=3376631 RepID=UPI003C26DC4F